MQRPARDPAVVEEAAEHDEEEQEWKRHHEIGEPGDHSVGDAAEVARDRAEDEPDRDREHGGADRDFERDAPAVEQPQELVAAELAVRAEQEQGLLRPLRRILVGEREGIVVGERRGRPGDRQRARGPQRDVDRIREEVVGPMANHPLVERGARADGKEENDEEDAAAEGDPVAAETSPRKRPRAFGAGSLGPSSSNATSGTRGGLATAIRVERLDVVDASRCRSALVVLAPLRRAARRRSRRPCNARAALRASGGSKFSVPRAATRTRVERPRCVLRVALGAHARACARTGGARPPGRSAAARSRGLRLVRERVDADDRPLARLDRCRSSGTPPPRSRPGPSPARSPRRRRRARRRARSAPTRAPRARR